MTLISARAIAHGPPSFAMSQLERFGADGDDPELLMNGSRRVNEAGVRPGCCWFKSCHSLAQKDTAHQLSVNSETVGTVGPAAGHSDALNLRTESHQHTSTQHTNTNDTDTSVSSDAQVGVTPVLRGEIYSQSEED